MKALTQYIAEYLIKKKIDKVRIGYKYIPKTKDDLVDNIKELLDQGETNLNCIDTSNITDMSNLFSGINYKEIKLKNNIDISGWNVSNVTTMRDMFSDCENFKGTGLENWDVSNVENMYCMFASCYSFKGVGVENWNVSNVENMGATFFQCKNFNSDLSNWDVSNVKDMGYMFSDCEKFEGKGVENWKVSKINIRDMFYGCFKIKKIPSWYYRIK